MYNSNNKNKNESLKKKMLRKTQTCGTVHLSYFKFVQGFIVSQTMQ